MLSPVGFAQGTLFAVVLSEAKGLCSSPGLDSAGYFCISWKTNAGVLRCAQDDKSYEPTYFA